MSLTSSASQILDLVKGLTVVELNELVKAMEEEFGVSAAASVVVAGAGAAVEEVAKDTVNLELTEAGQQKIAVIKVVKELLGIDLKAAKDIVEAAPKMIKENVKFEEAEAMKSKLEEAGAKVSFR